MTTKHYFTKVVKRDGRIVPFDQNRIVNAIYKAMKACQEGDLKQDPQRVSDWAVRELTRRYPPTHHPHIEEIQDVVEEILITKDFPKTAKAYILYRQERTRVREKRNLIPKKVKKLVQESKKYFRNKLAELIYYQFYSRWIGEEGRRETWVETIDRYINFMKENLGSSLKEKEYQRVKKAILHQEVSPSMRLLWGAGKAAKATNVTAYNCSYIAPTKLKDFAEIMYLSMCGAGVGFSVESQTAQQLPIIRRQTGKLLKTHFVEDSKEGWAEALTFGLKTWYEGRDIKFDYSKLRPAGAHLKTMGGRSSGPDPLHSLFNFARAKILSRQGKRLSNLDVHDIICKIAEIVVAGGVRRSAMISLSDLDDEEMRQAKTGQFYLTNPQRAMANNSAVYNEKPSATKFLEEWLALTKAGTGERGIFNRQDLKYQLPQRRWKSFKKHWPTAGTNPCGEIVLPSKSFCNLSTIVARPEDTEASLLKKIEIATLLGTYQSMLTNFPFLSKEWKKNCEEERLLGVSITGFWDSPITRQPATLQKLRQRAIEVNRQCAKRFGIKPSTCITCVKPAGNSSQLLDTASGLHPRHSPYYIRRIRISAGDPLFQMLKDQKFPYKPEVGQAEGAATTYVLEFPVAAPKDSVYRNDLTALEQLEHWKIVKENYTEHNPSVTISIGQDEWIEVADWLYEHWSILGGLAFLPREDYVYPLAPYEEITKKQYQELAAKLPEIDFSQILVYEQGDQTIGARELACVAGVCETEPIEAAS